MKSVEYASSTKEQLEKEFSTSFARGLSQTFIDAYHSTYGHNGLTEQHISGFSILIRQFCTPFVYLLASAALVSFFLGDLVNGCTILVIICLNSLLSFYQEYKAEQSLKLLKAHLVMTTTVLRDGIIATIQSTELIPGDIVLLETGDYIPADIVLFQGALSVNESVLTGESIPVKKESIPSAPFKGPQDKRDSVCFFSTTVTQGNAQGVVVATGSKTMFGEISQLTLQTVQHSGFQERLARLSMFILSITLISLVCLLVFHLLIKGGKTDMIQLLLFGVALTLGLTPEALPTVVTFALSRGALQLAHHNVIVKRLSAIEDLGAITVLCTDKTGTLTENKLSISDLYDITSYDIARATVLRFFLLASKKGGSADPFDTAIIEASSPELLKERDSYEVVQEAPFDPALRRNSVLLSYKKSSLLITRGSFESIQKVSLPIDTLTAVQEWITTQSAQGNRVLAVAYKENPESSDLSQEGFTFAGLAAFHDPIKQTTRPAIIKAGKLGITIKMITGDSAEVAASVAHAIELPTTTITGPEFAALSLKEKQQAVKTYTIFARILPQQKYEIVNLLKEGNVVGFVGEGINDAPALKAAHVGLAVKGARDIAQDAADIILLSNNLFAIIKGISIGRNIFSNTMKYIVASISSNFGNCYSVAIASLFIDFLPLLPLQILLINLVSDLPMIAIATDTVDYDELKVPQKYDLGNIAFLATILGITSSVFDFITFTLFYRKGPKILQTNWFIESILTELVLIYSVRTKGLFYKAPRPSLVLVSMTLLAGALTLILPLSSWGRTVFHFTSPTKAALTALAAIVTIYFFTTELVKILYYRYKKTTPTASRNRTKS